MLILLHMRTGISSENQKILAIATFAILILLLLIQISWIYRSARLEEQNFNHRVSMALKGARDEIGLRVNGCTDMSDYLCMKQCTDEVHQSKRREVDSIIRANLSIYNIELPYTFEITDTLLPQSKGLLFNPTCYKQNLNGIIDQNGVQIRLQFPTRNQFLIAQLWSQLGISVAFILFIMISFLITWRLYKRERNMMLSTSDFINNMVHEFQTPIANIRFATKLIAKDNGGLDVEKKSEYVKVILDETLRLQSHVESILRISSSGSDEPLLKEQIDVHKLVRDVIGTFSYHLQHAGGKVDFNPEATEHFIEGEAEPVRYVISNLIDNALKYVHRRPVINIETRNKDRFMVISVTDNGIGIKKEDQERIFEKYYRVSTGDVHNIKGFGLGLAYVKKVVESHGGKVDLESVPGKGSKFLLYFPLKENKNNG